MRDRRDELQARAAWVAGVVDRMMNHVHDDTCNCFSGNDGTYLTPEEESIIEMREAEQEYRMLNRLRANDLI